MEFDDDLIDRIRRATFVTGGDDPETAGRHRRSIARLMRAVAAERGKGRSDDLIRRAMINGTRHEMQARGVPEDSPAFETEFARATRSIDAILELTRNDL